MSAKQVLELLRIHRHPPGREWVTFSEVRSNVGYADKETNHSSIDLFAVNCYPSKKFRSVAYEVKVDRADFQRELLDPTKRQHAESVAMECWFATPPGLVRPDEVPEGWGLVSVSPKGSPKTLKMPTQRLPAPWVMSFIICLLRKAADPPSEIPLALWQMAGKPLTISELKDAFHSETAAIREAIEAEIYEKSEQRHRASIAQMQEDVDEAYKLRDAIALRIGIEPRRTRYMPVDDLVRCIDAPQWDPRILNQAEELRKDLTKFISQGRAIPPVRREFPKGEAVPLLPLEDDPQVEP